jgi:predicted  nucleic acid-binding Zn-ribbon protein
MMELAFPRYEDDFALWVETQADLLRKREFAQLDIANLLDELSDMAGHLRRELKSRMIVLLQHLLKCREQPARLSKSWMATIREQRREIAVLLKQSPSLRRTLPDVVAYAYPHAVTEAADDTGLASGQFPAACPWSIEAILGEA